MKTIKHQRTDGSGASTYVNEKGQVGYRDCSMKPIGFAVNPGPTMTCGKCGNHGWGVDMLTMDAPSAQGARDENLHNRPI